MDLPQHRASLRPLTRYAYSFKQILYAPLRFLKPPASQGAVRVRGFSVVPLLEVSLQDVLEGRHLPPLTAADFEDYLRFVEHSVENLYFIHWLDDYTAKYRAQMVNSPHEHSSQLALSYARAKATFFSPRSNLEVNIDGVSLSTMLHPADPINASSDNAKTIPTCPSPEQFTRARNEIEHMLRNSLTNFITTHAQGNACILHLLGGIICGILCIICGFIVILCQITQHPRSIGSKGVRLAAMPFFLVGFTAMIGCLHGVCFIMWLFGEGRQLRDYELARPEISGVLSHTTLMPLQGIEPARIESRGESIGGVSGINGEWTGREGDDCQISSIQLGHPSLPKTSYTSVAGGWKDDRTRCASLSPSTRSGSSMTIIAPSPSITKPQPVARTASSSLSPIITANISTPHLTIEDPPDDQRLSSISLAFDPSDPSPFTSSSPAHISQPFLARDVTPGIFPEEPPPRPPASDQRDVGQRHQFCYANSNRMSTLVQAMYHEFHPTAASERIGPKPRVFGPMTRIESCVIQRSNWEVVVRTLCISMTLTAVLLGSLWCVPTHKRS